MKSTYAISAVNLDFQEIGYKHAGECSDDQPISSNNNQIQPDDSPIGISHYLPLSSTATSAGKSLLQLLNMYQC